MHLSWKDLVTTLLAMAVAGVYYANSKGLNYPVISGVRGATVVLLIVGMFMCAFGSRIVGGGFTATPMLTVLSILGGIAFVLAIIGLITGNKTIFAGLAGLTLILWFVSTIRHLVVK
jgi:hypothetical protein